MANCNKDGVSMDMLVSCAQGEKPKGGVVSGGKILLVNYDDIDFGTATYDATTPSIITNVTLKSGKTGYHLEYIKELASANAEFSPNEEGYDGFVHNFLGRLSTNSAENAVRASELHGGKFIVIIETAYKGADGSDAFKLYGWDAGLKLSAMTNNTAEAQASITFTLSTKANEYETYPFNVYFKTDYATTSAAVENKLAAVV